MNLKEELQAFGKQMSENAPKEALETIGNEIGAMFQNGVGNGALKEGDIAPDFTLQDSNGTQVSLKSALASGPVALSFNRGNWCPFCNIEFKHLQQKLEDIQKAGMTLLVVSPQLPEKSKELKEKNGYDYPILYDKDNKVAQQYGLSFTLSEPLRPIHKAFEMDIPAHNGNDSYGLPIPATYVISTDGKIIYSFVNPNWMERAEPDNFIEAIK